MNTAEPAPEVIRVTDVSKRFTVRKDSSIKERIVTLGRAGRKHKQDFWALKNVSLDIRAGSTVGLIGHNGSGKSTLLKVIGGIIDATSGTVEQRGRLAALLELGAGFHPDLTGRENVYLNASVLGLTRGETDDRFDEIVAFSGIGDFIDTQVKFYSSGMYVRLAFAVAVHTDPDILLVDEVLAVGDEAFQRKCLDKIKTFQSEGRTIVIVSHSMAQITELCDRAVLLNAGNIVHDGDPDVAVAHFRDILDERRLAEEADAHPDESLEETLPASSARIWTSSTATTRVRSCPGATSASRSTSRRPSRSRDGDARSRWTRCSERPSTARRVIVSGHPRRRSPVGGPSTSCFRTPASARGSTS